MINADAFAEYARLRGVANEAKTLRERFAAEEASAVLAELLMQREEEGDATASPFIDRLIECDSIEGRAAIDPSPTTCNCLVGVRRQSCPIHGIAASTCP